MLRILGSFIHTMNSYENTLDQIDKSLPPLEVWYIQIFGIFIALFFTGVVLMMVCGSDGKNLPNDSTGHSPKKKKQKRKEMA